MRPSLKYGIPLAGGLATAGYAASQGEDPGTALLAGLAGGAGAAAGLVGARQLAGKYAPDLYQATRQGKVAAEKSLLESAIKMPEGSKRQEATLGLIDRMQGALPSQQGFTRGLGKAAAVAGVPASAALAGLGGVAAGAIPAAMGVPGFQQQVVDPESYGSSNSPGARYKAPTMQYV